MLRFSRVVGVLVHSHDHLPLITASSDPRVRRLAPWAFVLPAMALALWIWTRPLSVPATWDIADEVVRSGIRSRLAREVTAAGGPERGSGAPLDDRVRGWIEQNRAQFEAARATLSAQLQSQLRYDASDGRAYVYLGDLDSYAWLRQARNYLRTGTICDAIVDGECRDTYGHAPFGSRMTYDRPVHVAAIVGLHRLIRWSSPDHPLPASAMLVPVVIGVLSALPAFFIGRRLAGHIGGLWAAVVVPLHPFVLRRSLGSDNDVWNVVLPLFMVWAVMAALDARSAGARAALAVIAGGFAGLHAATWRGWFFTYAVVLCGLLGSTLLVGLAHAVRSVRVPDAGRSSGVGRVWQAPEVRVPVLVGVVFYVAAGVFATAAGLDRPYVEVPVEILRSVVGRVAGWTSGGGGDGDLWPSVLAEVVEVRPSDLALIVLDAGGKPLFFGGLVGLLMLVLPRGRWRGAQVAMLIGGAALYGSLVAASDLGRAAALGLVSLPLGAVLLLRLAREERPGDRVHGGELIVAAWFLAGLYVAYSARRFLLLLAPPLGIALAAAAGRVSARLGAQARGVTPRHGAVATLLLFALLAAMLIPAVQRGYRTARGYRPLMNDAWWDSLTTIRDRSSPDAIVNATWDYGYWIKYVAERRVTADGGSLATHAPYWFYRMLMSASERESLGLLRMLNCGSDATPAPEGRRGAYGKLRAKLTDPVVAQSTVVDLARLDRPEAARYLAGRGFTAAEQDDVLASTHCQPPESYLVVEAAPAYLPPAMGLWDFRRAYVARQARRLPPAEAVADLVTRFAYTREEASALDAGARTIRSEGERDAFVVPPAWYASGRWRPCRAAGEGAIMRCPVERSDPGGGVLGELVYDPGSPDSARLRARNPGGVGTIDAPVDGTPSVLLVAGPSRLQETTFASPTYPEIGVLLDIPNRRTLLGGPPYLRSTFTHLTHLEGRYATAFEKFNVRTAYTGARVVTWKVTWNPGPPKALGDSRP